MKATRITLATGYISTDKALLKALESANRHLNKQISIRKKEGILTMTGCCVSIKLALGRAGFTDDSMDIIIEHIGTHAGIRMFNAYISNTDRAFQIAIDEL